MIKKAFNYVVLIGLFLYISSGVSLAIDPSSWNLLYENCDNITDWTDNDYDTGVSEVDPAGQFRFDTNTGAAGNAYAGRYRDIGSYPDLITFELKLYHDDIGTYVDIDRAQFFFYNATERFVAFFCSDGLFIRDTDSGETEVGTNLVLEGTSKEWQTWRFLIDYSGATGDGTCDVYLKNASTSPTTWTKVGSDIPCSHENTSESDGYTAVSQRGDTTNDMVTHMNHINAAMGLYVPGEQPVDSEPDPGVLDIFTNYRHYYYLTVPMGFQGDQVEIDIKNITTEPGLKAWGYCRDDLKDLRLAHYNTGTSTWDDIARDINTNKIEFQMEGNHTLETEHQYALYFGYASESLSPQAAGISGTFFQGARETAKRNKEAEDSLVLDSSVIVNDDADYAFGGDQTTGRQVSGIFTPTTTGQYSAVEVLVRQRAVSNISAYDMIGEVWAVNATTELPTEVIGRGKISTYGVEKSTGSYQWLRIYFPSKIQLTQDVKYAFVAQINGSGSATQAINFAVDSVAANGTLAYRTRTGSSWNAWAANATKSLCAKVYRGTAGIPGRKVSLTERYGTNPVLEATDTPSWEAIASVDNAEHLGSRCITKVGSEYRVVYASYNDAMTWPSIVRTFGAANGTALTSLSKVDQAVLINLPTGTHEMNTPMVYDWTAGDYKMYYRCYYTTPGPNGERRHTRHASSANATWTVNEANGGWSDNGNITYPWPVCDNVMAPVAWDDDGTINLCEIYLLANADDAIKRRAICSEQDATLTLQNAKPCYVDLTDVREALTTFGPQSRHELGSLVHAFITVQYNLSGDLNGDYYFEEWVTSSADGQIWSSPYPLLSRQSNLSTEPLGCSSTTFVGSTSILYNGYKRYWMTGGTSPYVDVQTNLATIAIESAGSVNLKSVNSVIKANIESINSIATGDIKSVSGIE